MATLTVNGRKVTVDDSFRSLSPEEQNATVEEIAKSLGGQQPVGKAPVQAEPGPEPARKYKQLPNSAGASSMVAGMQGLTFGLADEMTAGALTIPEMIVGAVTGEDEGGLLDRAGQAYDRALTKQRDSLEQARRDHPIASAVGEIAGAMATGAKAGQAGLTMLGRTGSSLGGRAMGAAIDGAVYGGLYGFGSGEGGLGKRLAKSASDAAKGAAIGGAIPPVMAAGAGLYRGAKQVASPVTTAISSRLNPEDRAARLVSDAFTRDGVPIDQAAQRIGQMSRNAPDAVLADVGGSNVRGRVRAAVNVPGTGREAILETIEARNLAQPDRISEALKGNLKDPAKFGQAVGRMAAQREKIASPIYQQAFSNSRPVDVTGVVKHIDETVTPGVNKIVNPMSDLRPDGTTATLARMRSFFATAKNQRYDLRALHAVKMEIDGMIGTAKRAGDDTKARALLGVQRRLLQSMDAASPAYRKARGIYSSTHEMDDALELGQAVFRMSADEVRGALRGLTPGEREMVQLGAARAIQDRIAKQRDGRDIIKAVFGTPAIRDTMRAMFQNDQAFRKFQGTLMREALMRRTGDAARGNSTTAMQQIERAELEAGSVGRDTLELLLEGHPMQAAATAIRQIIKGEQGINEKVADKMAEMLLSKDPTKIQNAIKMLKKKERVLGRIRDALRGLDPLLAPAGAASVSADPRAAAIPR